MTFQNQWMLVNYGMPFAQEYFLSYIKLIIKYGRMENQETRNPETESESEPEPEAE